MIPHNLSHLLTKGKSQLPLPEHGQMHDRVGRVFPPLHLTVNDAGVLSVSIYVVNLRHVATVRLTKMKSGIDPFS